ncbi:MAG: hypothetical protein QOI95_1590 [Acidimicrobiaceae bacterium]
MRRLTAIAAVLTAALGVVIATPPRAQADVTTYGNDTLRTGWYPDQPGLSPSAVSAGDFGKLFTADVTGQVYAQPLVSNGVLLVATESNDIYGLDPETGAQKWTRHLHTPWNPADLNCADLTPNVGITGTPVVDPATGTEYLLSKTYVSGTTGDASWYAHAIDVTTGAERPGFPLLIRGTASNDSTRVFKATNQMQRPGLLLMNGVVYAAFGGHCDQDPYQGWVIGFTTAGRMKTLWVAEHTANGEAGIWMSGGGLVSDRSGSLLLTTGNGATLTAPTAGPNPPASTNFGESIVRLTVQSNGSLAATDFFTPYDADYLNTFDGDLGSAAPMALPTPTFGTATIPHLVVQSGKEGYVYLLDGDNLGGYKQGPQGGDAVVNRLGPSGGVWSKPAAWPGDGGWVYLPTASAGPASSGSSGVMDVYHYGLDGNGKPTLALSATSADAFGFGSGAPVVTSTGTASGSALVWTIWMASGTGRDAQLRAYDPIPVNGTLQLRWSAAIGTASKFAVPAVSGNRVYVGARDGHVHGFGRPVQSPMSGSSVQFPDTVVGSTSSAVATLTANQTVTVSSVAVSPSTFAAGSTSPSLPATLHIGDTLSVPVSFTPTQVGVAGGTLTGSTDKGTVALALSGRGLSSGSQLAVTPTAISFGGIAVGQTSSQTLTISNTGSQNLTIQSVTAPAAPFSTSGAPPNGSVIAPGNSTLMTASFSPSSVGVYGSSFTVTSNGGTITVNLTGSAGSAAQLQVTPLSVTFGSTIVGASTDRTFTVSNVGGTNLTITKSKPPISNGFSAVTSLPEGTVLQPNQQVVETVRFAPSIAGSASSTWELNGDGASSLQTVALSGTGTFPSTKISAPATVEFGTVTVGLTKSVTVRLTNTSNTPVQITGGTPPSGAFGGALPIGKTVPANGSLSFKPSFKPTTSGATSSSLRLDTDDGPVSIDLLGRGRLALPAPAPGTWSVNGSASMVGSALTLTPPAPDQAGSGFYTPALSFDSLTASFDLTIDQGNGADGATFAIIPSTTPATSVGLSGLGLGWTSLGGVAVTFDTYQNSGDPSRNFLGVATGYENGPMTYAKTSSAIPTLFGGTHHVDISLNGGSITVRIDGASVLKANVGAVLPHGARLGFTAGTGSLSDRHMVTNVAITCW